MHLKQLVCSQGGNIPCVPAVHGPATGPIPAPQVWVAHRMLLDAISAISVQQVGVVGGCVTAMLGDQDIMTADVQTVISAVFLALTWE